MFSADLALTYPMLIKCVYDGSKKKLTISNITVAKFSLKIN